MRTPMRSPTKTIRPARRRHRARRPAPVEALPGPGTPEPRERVAGRPLDEALYTCGCGAPFPAAVTASVACPACGGAQSW
jgi:hypothetical protein